MEQPSQRPQRPAVPNRPDYGADATGLNSLPVDVDAVDDLSALAASVSAPTFKSTKVLPCNVAKHNDSAVRQTLLPLLLTSGLLCLGLAVAWWMTDADSPYRRVSVALPIVLTLAGLILFLAAIFNLFLIRRSLSSAARASRSRN